MKKIFLFLIFLPLIFTSCSSESEEFTELQIPFSNQDDELILNWKVEVINSEKEFQNITQTTTSNNVNFSKKSIIIVYGTANYGVSQIDKAIEKRDGKYYLNIIVLRDYTAQTRNWSVGYAVPKIGNEQLHVNVRYE